MLVPPTEEELVNFETGGEKPFIIYNAGVFPANRQTQGMTSSTSIAVSFKRREMVILGTQYAGEMKKGVFTVMNYLMPLQPRRDLIGDDEHVWTTKGVFNIEGGCYAKTIDLSPEKEPEVHAAIRYGSVLENVVWDEATGEVDYSDVSLTENTRASYPLKFMPNARIPATVDHQPKRVILLTCDAFGVLPPISKLTPEQVMYHFISGYTAKVAGTEMGITEPQATFSACFGAPFLVWHPYVYAQMLAAKLEKVGAPAYLVNTGWTGGAYGAGSRMSLKDTRQLIDAIHDGSLENVQWEEMPIFGLQVPTTGIKDVPVETLQPLKAWLKNSQSADKFQETAMGLAKLFQDNFKEYADLSKAVA